MVDEKDFLVKKYIGKDKTRIQKWYMHYCNKCGVKRTYAPRNKSSLCQSCSCVGRKISKGQKLSISKSLKGNRNAANISPENVIKRTAKRMKISVDQYVAEKELRLAVKKMKKNMMDRLNRFMRDQRKSVKYFGFSREELIVHFESRFHVHPETNEFMTWLNYGRIKDINCWEIDHIIPLRYKENGIFYWNQEELKNHNSNTFKEAWSLNNLKPMWAKLNWSKGSRYKG